MDLMFWAIESITRVKFNEWLMEIHCEETCLAAAAVDTSEAIYKRLDQFPATEEKTLDNVADWLVRTRTSPFVSRIIFLDPLHEKPFAEVRRVRTGTNYAYGPKRD